MSLDFAAKHNVITYLSDTGNWRNEFNWDFLEDKTRRWSSVTYDGIQVTFDKEEGKGDEVILNHIASGASVLIQRQDIGFLITDERGISVTSNISYSERLKENSTDEDVIDIALRLNDYSSSATATVEHLGIKVQFTPDGQKRITFENSNRYIELEAATKQNKEDLATGRFFQVIHFNGAFLEELARQHPRTFVQIVAAKDMGLEPTLRVFNGLASFESAIKLQSAFEKVNGSKWEGPEEWNPINLQKLGGLNAIEKPWRDTAEFNGYKAAIPTLFSIRKQGCGFDLHTSSAGKDRILTRGRIFDHATNNASTTHSLPSVKLDTVLKLLADADTIVDREGKNWHFTVIDHQGNFDGLKTLSKNASDQYNLSHHEFFVLNISPNKSILAIQQTNLERILNGQLVNPPQGKDAKPQRTGIIDPAHVV